MGEQVQHRHLAADIRRPEPGSTSETVVFSDSSPSSTSCMIIVAVQTLVMDPTWNTESVVTGTCVAAFSTPCAARISCPSDQMPSAARGRSLHGQFIEAGGPVSGIEHDMDANSPKPGLTHTARLGPT